MLRPMSARELRLFACALVASLAALPQCSLEGLSDGADASAPDADVTDGASDANTPIPPGNDGAGGLDANTPIVLPDGALDCSVHVDGKLHCSNTLGATLYAQPTYTSAVVDHLGARYSAFDCWGIGDKHAGNNTTWYRTYGNDNVDHPRQGWVAGVDLATPDQFDANPSAAGLPRCP
jgi:hypothetical protein